MSTVTSKTWLPSCCAWPFCEVWALPDGGKSFHGLHRYIHAFICWSTPKHSVVTFSTISLTGVLSHCRFGLRIWPAVFHCLDERFFSVYSSRLGKHTCMWITIWEDRRYHMTIRRVRTLSVFFRVLSYPDLVAQHGGC